MPVIFLLNGVSSFPDPGNWGPVNKVECLGSGGRGGMPYLAPLAEDEPAPTDIYHYGGGGGGGGGYIAKSNSPAVVFPVAVSVAQKNRTGSPTSPGYDSTWWITHQNNVPGCLQATWGDSSITSTGGAGGRGFSPDGIVGNGGGSGGAGYSFEQGYAGGGGGGAAGPSGWGENGFASTTPETPGKGGGGDNLVTPRPPTTAGSPGVNGTQWDATHGCGSGGTGGTMSIAPGGGGNYGGGGGGRMGDNSSAGPPGSGQDGLLIITYTPVAPATTIARAMIMI